MKCPQCGHEFEPKKAPEYTFGSAPEDGERFGTAIDPCYRMVPVTEKTDATNKKALK